MKAEFIGGSKDGYIENINIIKYLTLKEIMIYCDNTNESYIMIDNIFLNKRRFVLSTALYLFKELIN
jgi:hypothetical protein